MALKIYSTLSRKVQSFKPMQDNKVKLYSCGPTVYNVVHIGNWRAFLFVDLFKRYIKAKGFSVDHVMNITDVDDKIIRDCQKQGISRQDFTKKYTDLFLEDLKSVNILPADHMPRATDFVQEMIVLIESLIKSKHAYISHDGVYFKVESFKSYGKLANLDLSQLQAGASGRVSADEYEKGNVQDFALWKFYVKDDWDVVWDAPFGKGRPGWHIECSAMAQKLLGNQVDVHMGGVDLIFPHHQNEIAQIEPITKKPFAKYWLHNEHLMVDGKKMSKSLGNFYTLRDLLAKGFKPMGIRYLLMATHYRQKLNLTFEAVHAAEAAVKGLDEFILHLEDCKADKDNSKVLKLIEKLHKSFEKAMDNDLAVSEALAVLHEFMTSVNKIHTSLSTHNANDIRDAMKWINEVLGVMSFESHNVPKNIWDLTNKREVARKSKDWKSADAARDELKSLGWTVEDLPDGPRPRRL